MKNLKTEEWEILLPWLKFYFTEGLGCLRIARIVEYFGSASTIFTAAPGLLQKHLPARIANAIAAIDNNDKIQQKITQTCNWLNAGEHHYILCPDSEHYPDILRQLPDYPPVLFASGNINLLQTPMLAIVGSRRPTLQGKTIAEKISFELAKCGLTIVSGLAAGVDACAHYGALNATKSTVAVIGTGIDKVYPLANLQLTRQMKKQGLIISEFPLGTPPAASNFPKRNRIISGLSLGVLVVEAAERSGSLITARLALEQGRDVFAIPGAINNLQSKGCHRLIRDGAVLVYEASQIVAELKLPIERWIITEDNKNTTSSAEVSKNCVDDDIIRHIDCPVQRNLLQALGSESWHADELMLNMTISQEELMSALTLLEINGMVTLGSYGYSRIFN